MKEKIDISLDKINREHPFTVPENYFENFALQMENKISVPKKTMPIRKIKSWALAAAVFLGVILAGAYYSKLQNDKKAYVENYESYVLSQVDESAMLDYYITDNNTNKKQK